MHVCVLGSGIVRLATAYSLCRAGHEVTVVDRASPGSGASGGNGAQFLAACNGNSSRNTTAQLLALATLSRQAFDAMMRKEKLDCDFSATGKLVLYPDATSFAAACRQMLLQRQLGSTQEAINADRWVEIEPALKSRHRQISGAIYTPGECAADCQKTCNALLAVLRRHGVRFLLETPIEQLLLRGKSVVAVATPQGHLEADQYVMALGADSARMARALGVHLPIYPLKGYSITVEVDRQARAAPAVSVTDSARNVVFARIGSRLRVAGMAELSGYDTAIYPAQIASLKATTQTLFPKCSTFADLSPWTGMRPATPTGLPIIGKNAKGPDNLLFNTGHGALGFTLAFGSAQRVSDLLSH